MNALYFSICLFTLANCKSFHQNQHLPIQRYQPPLRYQYQQPYPAYFPYYTQPAKNGYSNEPTQSGDLSDIDRQYQQWQIAIPNQQQGGIVWISAPQYAYPPPNTPGYPPAPPSYPSASPDNSNSNQNLSPNDPNNPNIVRDTIVPSVSPDAQTPPPSTDNTTITLSPIETPSTEGITNPPSTSTTTTSEPTSTSSVRPSTSRPTTTSTSRPTSTSTPRPTSTSTSRPTSTSTSRPTGTSTSRPTSTSSSRPTTTTQSSSEPSSEPTTSPYNETSTSPSSNSTNSLLKYCLEPRGQFEYPPDCTKFVNCWEDIAVEQSCPNGLAFNPEKKYCDYPENVNCTISLSSNSTSPNEPGSGSNSTEPGNNSKCPSSYGTYRNASNCAAFYVCVSGEPVNFDCPPGTAYSDELKVCDYPYRVDCKGAPYTPPPEEPETTEPIEESNSTSPYPPTSSSSESSSVSSTRPQSPNSSTRPPSPNSSTRPSSPNSSTRPSSPNSSNRPSSTTPLSTTSTSTTTTTSEPSSTDNPPAIVEQPEPLPPSVNPVGQANSNLKRLPESIVNTGVRCYHENVFRLTPDCSSVTVCQDGLTYIVNCGSATSFDAYSQRCVPSFRARC